MWRENIGALVCWCCWIFCKRNRRVESSILFRVAVDWKRKRGSPELLDCQKWEQIHSFFHAELCWIVKQWEQILLPFLALVQSALTPVERRKRDGQLEEEKWDITEPAAARRRNGECRDVQCRHSAAQVSRFSWPHAASTGCGYCALHQNVRFSLCLCSLFNFVRAPRS